MYITITTTPGTFGGMLINTITFKLTSTVYFLNTIDTNTNKLVRTYLTQEPPIAKEIMEVIQAMRPSWLYYPQDVEGIILTVQLPRRVSIGKLLQEIEGRVSKYGPCAC